MSLPTSLVGSSSTSLPFYSSTNTLIFYLDDSSSLSQVLTLYNPYEFNVRYKVLCTVPQKYSIAEPQGEIRAQHSVDTVVRLLDTSSSSSNQNVEHRLRIHFFDRRKSQEPIGKRDVVCKILSHKPLEQNSDEGLITNRMKINSTFSSTSNAVNTMTNIQNQETRDPLLIFILSVLGIVCGIVLVLPTVPDSQNSSSTLQIPSYLHMTTNAKVIASYILGLLTVVFIRR